MPMSDARSYIATPTHEAAIGRVLHAVEGGEVQVQLVGERGIGKSTILRQVVARLRGPLRRVALAGAGAGSASVLDTLVDAIGGVRAESTVSAWQRLVDGLRLLRSQRQRAVFAIDDADQLGEAIVLERLASLAAQSGAVLLTTVRTETHEPGTARTIPVQPLTRGEVGPFVAQWLSAQGRDARFTARALTRLHGLARGFPRLVNGLAARSAEMADDQHHSVIRAETVENAAGQAGVA